MANIFKLDSASKLSVTSIGWLEKELYGCKFKDKRLEKRFKILCEKLASGIGHPIPFAPRRQHIFAGKIVSCAFALVMA